MYLFLTNEVFSSSESLDEPSLDEDEVSAFRFMPAIFLVIAAGGAFSSSELLDEELSDDDEELSEELLDDELSDEEELSEDEESLPYRMET